MREDDLDVIMSSGSLDEESCFLCGIRMGKDATSEHVFPKWLQRRHDLGNKQLNLLNRTVIKYNQLKVPCCRKCNNEHLGRLEKRVETAFRSGYSAVKKLPQLVLYQWMGKIFYGILRKEIRLLADRSNKDSGSIIPKEYLQELLTLRMFLQSIRRPFKFKPHFPFSALVVNLHRSLAGDDYDFRDHIPGVVASLRSNGIGIIVALQDAKLVDFSFRPLLKQIRGRRLIPEQFDELFASVIYKVSLLNRTPKFITGPRGGSSKVVEVNMFPLSGLSTLPVVADWNHEDYAKVLLAVVQRANPAITLKDVFVPPKSVMSWLYNESGSLRLLDRHGNMLQRR